MNYNICPRCGTENESEYTYCKNCGTLLSTVKETENGTYTNQNYSTPQPPVNGFQFGDITTEEMTLFIGKKSHNILPKFAKMEITNSKISWCWPVAILSLFFGALGASLWFFYRKMYKHAALLAVIGAVISILTTVLTGSVTPDLTEMFADVLESGDISAILNAFNNIPPSKAIIYTVSTLISDLSDIIVFILCGLFGYNIYKNHCIEKIKNYKMYQSNSPYYKLGLSSIGGVSGGMLALGFVIMFVTSNLSSLLTTLLLRLQSL